MKIKDAKSFRAEEPALNKEIELGVAFRAIEVAGMQQVSLNGYPFDLAQWNLGQWKGGIIEMVVESPKMSDDLSCQEVRVKGLHKIQTEIGFTSSVVMVIDFRRNMPVESDSNVLWSHALLGCPWIPVRIRYYPSPTNLMKLVTVLFE